MTHHHILTLTCNDRPGIVHAVTGGILEVGGNILENAQFTDPATNTFCMRTLVAAEVAESGLLHSPVAARLDDSSARLRVRRADARPRIMVMVSKYDHCLADLLYRWQSDLLPVEIAVVVSNHADVAERVRRQGVDFHHLPITNSTTGPTSKPEQEAKVLGIMNDYGVELIVLARYMQILSDDMCDKVAGRAINIHHSFLPGFKGSRPYHQAHERGVKLVGATAHFVTADLDEGPIIEQEVARVTHAHTPDDLVGLGQDTERWVLARAVQAWAEDRVLLVGDRTVVFP